MTDRKEKIQTIKSKKPFGILDLFVYIAAVVAVVFLIISLSRPKGKILEIYYYDSNNQKQTLIKKINEDSETMLPIGGTEVFIVVIEDGKAFVRESSCDNQICVHTGKISRVGQQIVCSPFRVVLQVKGESLGDISA